MWQLEQIDFFALYAYRSKGIVPYGPKENEATLALRPNAPAELGTRKSWRAPREIQEYGSCLQPLWVLRSVIYEHVPKNLTRPKQFPATTVQGVNEMSGSA